MAPIEVKPGALSDATSRGRTTISDALDTMKKGGGDPRLAAAFGRVAKKTEDAGRKAGQDLEKTGKTGRDLERNDARSASRLRGQQRPPSLSSVRGGSAGPGPMRGGSPSGMMAQLGSQAPMMASGVASPLMSTAGQLGGAMVSPSQMSGLQSAGSAGAGALGGGRGSSYGGSGRLSGLVRKVLGLPYAWGGGDLKGPTLGTGQDSNVKGFDCSSLARWLTAHDSGVQLPRTSEEQFSATRPRVGAPQPGDLVFPAGAGTPPGHVQVYLGDGKVVHAPQSGDVIKIAPLEQGARIHAASAA